MLYVIRSNQFEAIKIDEFIDSSLQPYWVRNAIQDGRLIINNTSKDNYNVSLFEKDDAQQQLFYGDYLLLYKNNMIKVLSKTIFQFLFYTNIDDEKNRKEVAKAKAKELIRSDIRQYKKQNLSSSKMKELIDSSMHDPHSKLVDCVNVLGYRQLHEIILDSLYLC